MDMRHLSRLLASTGVALSFAMITPGPNAVAHAESDAFTGACGLEHGYYACHYASERGQTVNISFPDTHVVTTATTVATLCSGNLSGIKEASTHMPVQSTGSINARVVNHDEGCADLYDLSFSKQGSWVLDLVFNDGDHGSFPIDVIGHGR